MNLRDQTDFILARSIAEAAERQQYWWDSVLVAGMASIWAAQLVGDETPTGLLVEWWWLALPLALLAGSLWRHRVWNRRRRALLDEHDRRLRPHGLRRGAYNDGWRDGWHARDRSKTE